MPQRFVPNLWLLAVIGGTRKSRPMPVGEALSSIWAAMYAGFMAFLSGELGAAQAAAPMQELAVREQAARSVRAAED